MKRALALLALAACVTVRTEAGEPTVARSRTEVAGCAAGASASHEVQERDGAAALSVRPVRGGAVVTHAVDHACCLKATTTTRLEGRTAIVHETLTGLPCRCRCASTLTTTIDLSPGKWRVVVELEDPNGPRTIPTPVNDVVVPAADGAR